MLTLDSHRGASAPIGSSIVFSPDGRYLAAGGVFESTEPDQVQKFNPLRGWRTKTERTPPVQIWDAQTGRPLPPLEGDNGGVTVLAFSPRGDMLATAADPLQDKAKQPDSVTIWDVATGRARYRLSGNSDRIHSLSFSRNSLLLAVSGGDGVTRFWQMDSGDLAGSLTSFAGGEWLVLTPSGFFDGSPGAWSRVSWRGSEDLADVGPVEQYFSECYRPGVLAEIMAGRKPEGARTISAIDRRQPLVKITAPATAESRSVPVRLEITDAGTGVHDVRLFRDGLLVKTWRGEQKLNAGVVTLETEVLVRAGPNQLTAYCFNGQNVKSLDVKVSVHGLDSLKRKGTAWIIAMGINQYANSEFNLKFAVGDEQSFASQLEADQLKSGTYDRVEVIHLTNQQATRANILSALQRLGNRPANQGTAGELSRLQAAQPEDAVFVCFAGHGLAQGDRFFLVPHDLGFDGKRDSLESDAVRLIVARSISDLDLESAFETVDARHIFLVIDACQSGQALESIESRRGPMNSRGLAQLAYEKGMHILTAAQSYQAALETACLGHGLLTFALVEEGLKASNADVLPQDGRIDASEWLEYAVSRVPQFQAEALQRALEQGRALTFAPGSALQTPRAFSRQESSVEKLVIAVRP